MPTPEKPDLGAVTDSIGSVLYICDGPGDTTPRKVDPERIHWPEGVPKPWEESGRRRQIPPAEE